MLMIIIGVMMEESVGRLFAGGFIPGIMMALSLIVLIYFQSFSKRIAFPPALPRASRAEVFKAFRESFLALLAPLIILGSILTGVATPRKPASLPFCIQSFSALSTRS
jgi:TRAP-type C4-dicarboxylate transport system permease large subunit